MFRAGSLVTVLLLAVASASAALPAAAPATAEQAAPALADSPRLDGLLAAIANPAAGAYLVHRNADVEATLKAVAAEHPELATVESIGKTTLGQDLWMITLAAPNSTGAWRVYLDGGHHGNEYLGTELMMAYLGVLVTGYAAQDEDVLAFLGTHTIKILPIVNPDGNLLDTRKNARQVNLNRNYPFLWGDDSGSSGEPQDFNYRGPAPLSEPESSANWAVAAAFQPDIWVTGHTGIAELYWPWGYTETRAPDDALFTSLEAPFEAATNGRIDAKQGYYLYPVTGANDDSGYALLGVPGFTFEVHEDGFQPAYPGAIGPAIAEQLAGLVWLVGHTRHLGANVGATAERTGDSLTVRLANNGWGEARNLTVNLTEGGRTIASHIVSVPARGNATVTFEGAPAGASIGGYYARLLINTTHIRELSLDGVPADLGAASGLLPTPGVPAAAVGALLAALAGVAARRGGRR